MSRSPSRVAFDRLVASHAASAAGDALVAVALAGTLFFDVPAPEARVKVGLYLLLTMAPYSLLGPLVGPAIDRRSGGRRLAVVVGATGRAVLAVVMASKRETLWLYPAAFGVLVLSRAHGVARSALVPAVTQEDRPLVEANARLAKAAVVVGAAAALPGALLGRLTPAVPLVGASIAYSLAALAGSALPRARTDDPPPADGSALEPTPRLRRALVVNGVVRALGGFLLFVLAFGLRRRGVSGAGFGLVLAASGIGSFAGATLVPRLRRSANEEWVLAVALVAGGSAALVASRSFGLDLAAVLACAVGIVSQGARLAFDSIAQRDAGGGSYGRTFARSETVFQLCWVAGAAVPVAVPVGIEVGLGLASGGFLAAALWFLVALGGAGRRAIGR